MFWLLLGVVVLLALVGLGLALLTLWRRVTTLGRTLAAAGEITPAVDALKAAAPHGAPPCPTCGAPASAAVPAAVPAARR